MARFGALFSTILHPFSPTDIESKAPIRKGRKSARPLSGLLPEEMKKPDVLVSTEYGTEPHPHSCMAYPVSTTKLVVTFLIPELPVRKGTHASSRGQPLVSPVTSVTSFTRASCVLCACYLGSSATSSVTWDQGHPPGPARDASACGCYAVWPG